MMKRIFICAFLGVFLLAGCAETQYRESKIRVKHRNWDDEVVEKVARRQVEPDMTGDMVRAAIGLPDKTSRQGDTEEWGYAVMVGDFQPIEKFVYFVYFKNGRVVRTEGDIKKLATLSWYK
jgi:outer membrane protein assembly factor BamE (lipoprotein component of BamABCDE complex)